MCACMALHPCLVSHTLRHPCLFMNALLALRPCLVSHQCRCVLQRLSVADFKHPCLKPLGVHFRHPCLFMNALLALRPCKAFGRSFQASLPCLPLRYINRRHYRKPCEQPAKRLKSFLPLTDFVLYSITQNQISLSVKITS